MSKVGHRADAPARLLLQPPADTRSSRLSAGKQSLDRPAMKIVLRKRKSSLSETVEVR
jgi:hypothetical protein